MMEPSTPVSEETEIRQIAMSDVSAALAQGWADFRRAPAFGLFFGAVFSIVGVLIYLQLVVWGTTYWALPLMAGFPLVGPFAAVGLYDVSRRLEQGAPLDWGEVLGVIARERGRQIPSMAFVTLFFFLAWVYFAHLIFALSFGLSAPVTGSPVEMLTSPPGLVMLAVGTAVGGILALLLFAITVVAVPMLLDREIDVITAMITSFRTVLDNRGPMLAWGAIVAGLSALAMAPAFLGMLVIFPVLGHASWHLYRRVIGPAA